MYVEIPLAGNCEIKELKYDFFTDPSVPLEDDFTVITKENSFFCCCDPDVTIALCKHLFNNNPFVQPLIDFNYPDIDYWFFCRNDFGISTAGETPFGDIFNIYLEFGFIKKIQHEEFKNITSEGKDYIYVYSDLYFVPSSIFFTKLAELAKNIASDIKEELIERYDYLDNEAAKEEYLSKLKEIDEEYHDCLKNIGKGLEDSLASL